MRLLCGLIFVIVTVLGVDSNRAADAGENPYFPLVSGMYSTYTQGEGSPDIFYGSSVLRSTTARMRGLSNGAICMVSCLSMNCIVSLPMETCDTTVDGSRRLVVSYMSMYLILQVVYSTCRFPLGMSGQTFPRFATEH